MLNWLKNYTCILKVVVVEGESYDLIVVLDFNEPYIVLQQLNLGVIRSSWKNNYLVLYDQVWYG